MIDLGIDRLRKRSHLVKAVDPAYRANGQKYDRREYEGNSPKPDSQKVIFDSREDTVEISPEALRRSRKAH